MKKRKQLQKRKPKGLRKQFQDIWIDGQTFVKQTLACCRQLSLVWSLMSASGLLFTLFYAWIYLTPFVTLSFGPPYKYEAMFTSPCEVKNSSVFPIYNVQVFLDGTNSLRMPGGDENFRDISIQDTRPPIPKIESDQTIARDLPDHFFTGDQTITSGDITVVVTYRPSFWPWEKAQHYRFTAKSNNEGELNWYPQ